MTAPRDEPLTESVVDGLSARAYVVPTTTGGRPEPETDGTARWDSTGVLVVEVRAAGQVGLGYAYTAPAALAVVRDTLSDMVVGGDPLATQRAFWRMASAVRNLGWSGVCAGAVSAVDIALHDLRARLLGVSLVRLLGGAGDRVTAYGSGGFTSYSEAELENQLSGWAAQGLRAVKMKVGRDPADDLGRVRTARAAIGPATALFVDANGAYQRKQALGFAEKFAELDVTWFEEPVSSDDLDGLRLLRDRAPSGMQVAAGEYGYTPSYFHAMLAAGAVDTLQADATRCGGVTGFILAAALAQGAGVPVSAHTAPALHATLGAALPNVVHVEYFHDHALIEDRFFDGGPELCAGDLRPDPESPGHGLAFAESRAEPYLRGEWAS